MNKKLILIPNVTSPKNRGDEIITFQLLKLLKKYYGSHEVIVHSNDPELVNFPVSIVRERIYQWAVFEYLNPIIRFIRLLSVFFTILLNNDSLLAKFLPKYLQILIKDYVNADFIVFAPGGYLRSQKGIKQGLNLMMQWVPFILAIKLNKKTITAPMSVGPFAYKWQEYITTRLLSKISTIVVRESESHDLLHKYGINSVNSTDLALTYPLHNNRKKRFTIGIVIRKWFQQKEKQYEFEKILAACISKVINSRKYIIQPVIQVHAPEYGDSDKDATERLISLLKERKFKILSPIILKDFKHAINVYGSFTFLVTVRLHAALIAITQRVPSMAISYEPKTTGIFNDLEIPDWEVTISANESEINRKIEKFVKNNNKNKIYFDKFFKNVKNKIRLFEKVLYQNSLISNKKVPSVTVALSAYNEEKNIKLFLNSVMRQKEEGFAIKKIIVVSDGSTDRTLEEIKKVKGKYKIEVIKDKNRKGKSTRLNTIYKDLDTDYLIQSDADVIFGHKFVIRDTIYVLEKFPDVGMCGGNPLAIKAKTFIEEAINYTFNHYIKLRQNLRNGDNPLSADGRFLAFRKESVRNMRIPSAMIANDRFAYYWMKHHGWKYHFVASAIVYFRSPQSIKDQIRQNTRFLAAPIRLKKHFPESLVSKEEFIPPRIKAILLFQLLLSSPVHALVILIINRYCYLQAILREKKLTAIWDMAVSTKQITTNINTI